MTPALSVSSPPAEASSDLQQPQQRPFAPISSSPLAMEMEMEMGDVSGNVSGNMSAAAVGKALHPVLVLSDGSACEGISFGAHSAGGVAGECVFQTGMVGYPESLTDPSYRGQILVLTYPLVGNYGVPDRNATTTTTTTTTPAGDVKEWLDSLPAYFESRQIHIQALVVAEYSHDYSHFLATSSLAAWLKENNVPALYGIDTRAITKKIREKGVLLGKILFPKTNASTETGKNTPWISAYNDIPWHDPNTRNLVAEVSIKSPKIYKPDPATTSSTSPPPLRILAIDVGMKFNQIRCFVRRGVELRVVPWDFDFLAEKEQDSFDGLFISNGPGDPTTLRSTIERLSVQLKRANKPIFGICLGHQLLALAAGAKTSKMKFGNRGHNIPCTDMHSGRCYITSQNHGFAVDMNSLSPTDWQEYFVNANDGSNEGIIHTTLPYFSVQFHPESTPGPWDTEFLFDRFIASVKECKQQAQLVPLTLPTRIPPPVRLHPRKVLILGSGGLSIGQAGEFDYSGSQAIKALKEEGIYTVLINPNIATIQTSKGLADKVYFLPVNPEFVRKVIKHEKPDGIYCTFGGQTALNVGVKLKDEFASLGVKVLGTPIETIEVTEDRELFAQKMLEIGEKCAQSSSATSVAEAVKAGNAIGYPLIVRAAYALGGLGSGFAENEKQLVDLCTKAFVTSPQVLVEKSMKGWKEIEYEVVRDASDNCVTICNMESMKGWKEIEYEVVRDASDNCVTICNMENFDPLGIHTGDSIVVAPSQTLSDEDYMMLRRTAINVIRHLGVIGECNIQYALNPFSKDYCIIEVNARLSRSSALASKATGYPLAFVAAKLGLGIPLTQVKNNVTKKTIACFEPSLDYCVVKIPRWDLKKFTRVSTKISSQMKSVGEVMSIGRTFEETIQKAIRSVEYNFIGFGANEYTEGDLEEEMKNPSDLRLFAIANAMHVGYTVDQIYKLTNIDKWFLNKLMNIVRLDKMLASTATPQTITPSMLRTAKQLGFSDRQIGKAIGTSELAIRKIRTEAGITPVVKQIDTVAAEFPCYTNYLYITYHGTEHDVSFGEKGVMVLGSGVYRIGSSVEFDWCAVRCIRTLRDNGMKTIMVNYNPETVSTDYDEADRLYFENLTLERVLDIYQIEAANGVVVCMGGQTPNNIALPLQRENVKILGTSPELIDSAENRYKFSRLLDKIGVDQPLWKELQSIDDARAFCDKVGFPVLVRPSYVLSGAAMNVVYSHDDLQNYLDMATKVSREYPVVITKFIEEAKEIELDAVAVDGKLIMHVISEHVENAGVHSGDATLIQPPQDLDPETVRKIEIATKKIGLALNVTGPYNIQFIAKNNEIKVIECNVRASRSFPFVSKVLGVDLIEMATKAIMGLDVEAYPPVEERKDYVGVKVPQFSFSRLQGADPILGVEMASTGEVACFGKDKYEAYLKALISTGFVLPKKNILVSIGSFKEKQEFLPSVIKLHQMGFKLFATAGTADFIQEHNIPVKYLESLDDETNVPQQRLEYSLTQHIANNLIDLYINLPSKNQFRRPASYMTRGYRSRRMAVDFAVPLITNIKCAKLFIEALSRQTDFQISSNDYKTSHRTVVLPGLVNIQAFLPDILSSSSDNSMSSSSSSTCSFESASRAAVAGGFTMMCNMPIGIKESVHDAKTMALAQSNCKMNAYCDYANMLAASSSGSYDSLAVQDSVGLYVGFDKSYSSHVSNIGELSANFKVWPESMPIVANAKQSDLASVLLLANLYGRAVHITNVVTKEDIEFIVLNKEKGSRVTCDVSVYNLFLSKESHPSASTHLGSGEDVKALWDNLVNIDCFSVGLVPYNTFKSTGPSDGKPVSSSVGFEDALPLLLTAVADGRLTLDDISLRMYSAPMAIFDLPEQPDTYIEVEIDRFQVIPPSGFEHANCAWSPLAGKKLSGCVHRVVIRGQTTYLDGSFFTSGQGRDVSGTRRVDGSGSVGSAKLQISTVPTPGGGRTSRVTHMDGGLRSPIRQRTDSLNIASGAAMAAASSMASSSWSGTAAVLAAGASPLMANGNLSSIAANGGSAAEGLQSLMRGPAAAAGGLLQSIDEQDNAFSGISGSNNRLTPKVHSSLSYIAEASRILNPAILSKSPFYRKHVVSVQQFTRVELHTLFGVAQELRTLVEKQGSIKILNGKVMCSAFYEASTRTSASFEAAMLRLGGSVVSINQITSSISKGESLVDTVRTLSSYGDVLVMRHPEPGSAHSAAKNSPVPVINAGDGVGEHPTQAFLDIFTIREELGTVNGLTITLVGDLKHGRTVHSLVKLLSLYDVKINYVSPETLKMPENVKQIVGKAGIAQSEYTSLDSVVGESDVIYVTRIQKERFKDLAEYEKVLGSYVITNKIMQKAKTHMIVMHPLPRINEIDPEVDFDQRAAYFRQMKYGLYVRMALLALVCGGSTDGF